MHNVDTIQRTHPHGASFTRSPNLTNRIRTNNLLHIHFPQGHLDEVSNLLELASGALYQPQGIKPNLVFKVPS